MARAGEVISVMPLNQGLGVNRIVFYAISDQSEDQYLKGAYLIVVRWKLKAVMYSCREEEEI